MWKCGKYEIKSLVCFDVDSLVYFQKGKEVQVFLQVSPEKIKWKDEANRPWSFSYIVDNNGVAHILTKKYSNFSKENNQNITYKTKKQRITLTEEQLHNIIRGCVYESVIELDSRIFASYAWGREPQEHL